MSRPENELDVDESSGVTTLRPVPSKPARLFELSESDSTAYFSATELLERGKVLAARASESVTPPAESPEVEPTLEPAPAPAPEPVGWVTQFRRASFARKASALLLPVLCALLLAKPLLKKPEFKLASEPRNASAPSAAPTARLALPAPSASAPTITLPHGVSAARAAADSVATGDFSRALGLYRELARREPKNQAYREAARILGERSPTRSP